jgi:HD-GYP domain-containing protein (c-di-GMP phosphodiesterase class II)
MIRSDIEPFIGIFSSLAALSQINLEVWNETQPLYSSAPRPHENSAYRQAQDFSAHVRRLATFQHTVFGDHQHVFGMPVSNGKKPIGALIAYPAKADRGTNCTSFEPGQQTGDDNIQRLLGHMAGLIEQHCGSQAEIESLASELTKALEDIYVYSTVAGQIKSLKFPGHKQTDLAEDIMEAMRMDLAFIVMPGREQNSVIVTRKDSGADQHDLESFVKNLNAAILCDPAQKTATYFMVNESHQNPAFSQLHSKDYRFLAVKIQHEGNLYGWLGLVSFNVDEMFRRSELRLLMSMAEQLALVIFGSDLYYDLERLLIHVVRSLVHAIEAKDEYTRGHSERVSHYCMRIADHQQMNEKAKKVLQLAALLHDIGKIGTPGQILKKPESLDDAEMICIKEHPQKGYNILKPLEKLSDSLPGILHHHERYDGQGYPSGLKGEEIPYQARLIAVADTFDALTTNRAYRAARSPEEALAIMEKESGTQLDPHCVAVFKEIINQDLKGKSHALDSRIDARRQDVCVNP